jgi:hypothetical protein
MRRRWVAFLFLACALPARADSGAYVYVVRYDHWGDEDERGYREFIEAIGNSSCVTVDQCLHDPANPFRASDKPGVVFISDCAQLPYILRFYYAWKRGLPFSYVSEVRPAGVGGDIRFTPLGNVAVARTVVPSGTISGYAIIDKISSSVSSATYRIHPDANGPVLSDQYSAALDPKSIRSGTLIYDPAGHLATVYRVEPSGRVWFFDAHPDNSVTRIFYDLRFARAYPGTGAGFKNWRPLSLVGATRRPDGVLIGGHAVLARNAELPDFSDEQYYGNGPRPRDADWASGKFTLDDETLDYYDYVRAKLAGGQLRYDPVKEIGEMVASNCSDLHYRGQAVDLGVSAGLANRAEPSRLPDNIYGTSGDWETYSTPSRDARLKTAFKSLRDQVERFVAMYRSRDPHLAYSGTNLVGDMMAAYRAAASKCDIDYRRTDGARVPLTYEDARERLFAMSFDPYQCIEHRWGANDQSELASCPDSDAKKAWYAAEQDLRNQIDRTYGARMDFSLADLQTPGPGKGVATPPDTDVLGYLKSVHIEPPAPKPVTAPVTASNDDSDD